MQNRYSFNSLSSHPRSCSSVFLQGSGFPENRNDVWSISIPLQRPPLSLKTWGHLGPECGMFRVLAVEPGRVCALNPGYQPCSPCACRLDIVGACCVQFLDKLPQPPTASHSQRPRPGCLPPHPGAFAPPSFPSLLPWAPQVINVACGQQSVRAERVMESAPWLSPLRTPWSWPWATAAPNCYTPR